MNGGNGLVGRICAALLLSLASALSAAGFPALTYTVAPDGSGDFRTVQEAIDAAPDYSKQAATVIRIRNGIYREKITIPANKQKLHLIGESADSTIITWDDYALKKNRAGFEMGTSATSTVFLYGDDFLCENLTIENAAGSGPAIAQACAITVDADRAAFIGCRFIGNQDTIYTYGKHQRQYFLDCYIEGTTDFIFGASTCWFENCVICSKANSYITAASTPEGAAFGYVFHRCRLVAAPGVDSVYLGRPWRPFARTVFIDCELGGHIRREGWHDWNKPYAHSTCFYAESGSRGAGAVSQRERASWSHGLSDAQLAEYTPENVLSCGTEIDKNGIAVPVEWFFKRDGSFYMPSGTAPDGNGRTCRSPKRSGNRTRRQSP